MLCSPSLVAFAFLLQLLALPSLSHSSLGNPYLFQGTRYDAETGFYFFRSRIYDSRQGRFLQRDPVWDEQNVGGWHTFVRNGPMSRRDPLGLDGADGENFKRWSGRPLWPKPRKSAAATGSGGSSDRKPLWPVPIEKLRAWREVQEEFSVRKRQLIEESIELEVEVRLESKRLKASEEALQKKLSELKEKWQALETRSVRLHAERRRSRDQECCPSEADIAWEMLEILRRQRLLEAESARWKEWGRRQRAGYKTLKERLEQKHLEAEGFEWEFRSRGAEIWGPEFDFVDGPFEHLKVIPDAWDWREGLIEPDIPYDEVSP